MDMDRTDSSRWPNGFAAVFLISFAAIGCDVAGVDIDGFEHGEMFPEEHADKTISFVSEMRVTSHALDFFEQEADNLVEELTDEGLSFCVPPTESGDIEACHEDATCADGSTGCQVDLELEDIEITTEPWNDQLVVDLVIDGLHMDEELPVTYHSTRFTSHDCWLDLHGDSSEEPADIPATIPLKFSIEHLSAFDDGRLDVGDIDIDIDGVDYDLHNRSMLQGCNAADWLNTIISWLHDDLLRGTVADRIDDQIDSMTRSYLCRGCEGGAGDCPSGASCDDEVCMYADDHCAPRLLGMEGIIAFEELIGDFLTGDDREIHATARVADSLGVDSGLSFSLRAGAEPDGTTRCAPVDNHQRPSFDPPPGLDALDGDQTPDGEDYMFGFGIHERALEQGAWSAWASGALCPQVGPEQVDMLTTNNMALLIDGLDRLAVDDAPVSARLSPQQPPELSLGDNDVENDEVVDGLVNLEWDDLDLHVYGFVQQRYARLFTLRVNTELAIGLVPDGDRAVQPVFGDFTEAIDIDELEVFDAALVSVDEEDFQALIPALLGNAVSPIIGAVAESFELPGFLGYQPVIDEDNFGPLGDGYVGLFASLDYVGLDDDTGQLRHSPPQLEIRDHQLNVERPPEGGVDVSVDLQVGANRSGVAVGGEDLEVLYRLDSGAWRPAGSGHELNIDDPRLKLQGEHRLELRARHSGEGSRWQREPTAVDVIVDYEPPRLEAWLSDDVIRVRATDAVDDEQQLQLRYRFVADGQPRAWSDWASVEPVELADAPGGGPLRVEMQLRDRAGHLAEEAIEVSGVPEEDDGHPPEVDTAPEAGCAAVGPAKGGFVAVVLGLLALLALRGRSRTAVVALVVAVVVVSGCRGGMTKAEPGCECEDGQACVDGECVQPSCDEFEDCDELVCDEDKEVGVCQEGECRCVEPCGGECGSGEACCLQDNSCHEVPDPCDEHSCEEGYEPKVGAEGNFDGETCELDGASCECEPIDALQPRYHGGYPSIDRGGGEVFLSVFDLDYGDLLVSRVTDADIEQWHLVEGVPDEGTIGGDPEGWRNGITTPGPIVGTHTATAVDEQGTAHVLYRHEDDEQLRYARSVGDGEQLAFETTTVDDDGDAGYFTEVLVRGDELEVVYTVRTGEEDSEVRHRTIDIDADVDEAGQTASQVIHTGSAERPLSEDYPRVAGLFIELFEDASGGLFVSLYDNTRQKVGWLTESGGDWGAPTYLDAEQAGPYAVARPDDEGEIHVAYMDGSDSTLKYRAGDIPPEIVADGLRAGGNTHSFGPIGHDTRLFVDGGGVEILYHDATNHQLRRATREGSGAFSDEVIAGDEGGPGPARGMFPRTVLVEGQRLLVDFQVDTTDPEEPVAQPVIRAVQ